METVPRQEFRLQGVGSSAQAARITSLTVRMIPLSPPIVEPMVKLLVVALILLGLSVKMTALSGRGLRGLLARPHAMEAPNLGQGAIFKIC